jgi:hypothetical protein
MQTKPPLKKCLHCQKWFFPNPKTAFRQRYCARKRCQYASKVASQRKWRDKPGNRKLADPQKEKERVYRWRQKQRELLKTVSPQYSPERIGVTER